MNEAHEAAGSRRRRSARAALVGAIGIAALGMGGVRAAAEPALPYGANTCVQGYVWRDAVPGDFVCVTPAARAQAASDNSVAASRRVLGECKDNFTPRLASPTDPVCVSPSTRAEVAVDNARAQERFARNSDVRSASSQPIWLSSSLCDSTGITIQLVEPQLRMIEAQVQVVERTAGNERTVQTHDWRAPDDYGAGGTWTFRYSDPAEPSRIERVRVSARLVESPQVYATYELWGPRAGTSDITESPNARKGIPASCDRFIQPGEFWVSS